MALADLIPILQLAIGPVILISGVGLLLLSMTNRFGRIIDRSRLMTQDLQAAPDPGTVLAQLRILARRARILRASIVLATLSVLLAALLIISLFLGALLGLPVAAMIVILFVLCLGCLIAALGFFISDLNLSLRALWLEIPAEASAQHPVR